MLRRNCLRSKIEKNKKNFGRITKEYTKKIGLQKKFVHLASREIIKNILLPNGSLMKTLSVNNKKIKK